MSNRKFLLVYYCHPLGLLTIQDNIQNFQSLSQHTIIPLNLYPKFKLPQNIQLTEFDGVIIDSTVAYFPQTLRELDDNIPLKLQQYEGIKVLLKQDEHVQSHEIARLIGDKKIDLVFTCLHPSQHAKVYPSNLVGHARFVQQYTGYFSDNLIQLANSMAYTRSIDLSYRGSIQPLQCGVLGYEKWQIGDAVNKKLADSNLNLDISYQWSARISSTDWIKFLSCSKAVLGVESGSNLFDFDGKVAKQCALFERDHADLYDNPEAYYQKAHQDFLSQYEGNVNYAQISPRHFEAAATKTLQILYEGDYSNIFVPYQHYLPLKRDLSNLEEIGDVLANAKKRLHITDCAYEEIVMNAQYHYKTKIDNFDAHIANIIAEKQINPSTQNHNTNSNKKNVVILVPHEPHLDPRIKWFAGGFNDFAHTNIVGTTHLAANIRWRVMNAQTIEANLNFSEMTTHDDFEAMVYQDYYHLMRTIDDFCQKTHIDFPNTSFYPPEAIERFQWYCNYFKRTDKALRYATEQLITTNNAIPDLLVCCDLSSLLSGVILSQRYQIPLVYDAHEFWPYSDVRSLPWEIDFWLHAEKLLLKYVDLAVTVSEGLAKKMSHIYQTTFSYIPNTERAQDYLNLEKSTFQIAPLLDEPENWSALIPNDSVKFLFLGQYAQGRGLEQLIDAWRGVNEKYQLILRGPYREYLDTLILRAKRYGLYNKTIFFFKPVKETELISTASAMDVGIIPYSQNTNVAYQYCCPNKLSQYMAAGIPILSNQLTEVAKIINHAHCGIVVDFDTEQDLINAIHQLGEARLRKQMGTAARDYFLSHYNWENQAQSLYHQSQKLMDKTHHFGQSTLLSMDDLAAIAVMAIPEPEVLEAPEAPEVHYVSAVNNVTETKELIVHPALLPLKHLVTRKIKVFNPMLHKVKQRRLHRV